MTQRGALIAVLLIGLASFSLVAVARYERHEPTQWEQVQAALSQALSQVPEELRPTDL